MKADTPSRPLLRYHGGKWRLAPWIISHFPRHRVYVEPYCGAASVLMQKTPSAVEVLNDKHQRLVNVFRVLRNKKLCGHLKTALRYSPCSETEYHLSRQISDDPVEDARRVIILGHQAHGSTGSSGGKLSGWRRGDRGRANAGSSSREWAAVWWLVDSWADRVRGIYLECAEASEVMLRWDAADALHYVDPPYISSVRTGDGNGSYLYEMTDSQHAEMAALLRKLRGCVVVSGYRSSLYDDLFHGWRCVERQHVADSGQPRIEAVWLSPNIESGELF